MNFSQYVSRLFFVDLGILIIIAPPFRRKSGTLNFVAKCKIQAKFVEEKMKRFITLLIIIAGFTGLNALEPANNSTFDSMGCMPEIVVTAPRFENEDDAWSGLIPEIVTTAPRDKDTNTIGVMSEIVVTAPRFENEDDAWSGLMPEIVTTAPRYDAYSGLTDTIYVTASRYDDTDIGPITMVGQTKPNTPGANNEPFQINMNNLDNNQSFSGDINFIILLVMMSFIIGLFVLLHYLRKNRRPAKVVCYCANKMNR